MLRRKPTRITLTTEDIAIYEDKRTREALQREQEEILQAQQAQQLQQQIQTPVNNNGGRNQNVRDPNDELKPIPGERVRAQQNKSREERLGLGLGRGGGGGSGSGSRGG